MLYEVIPTKIFRNGASFLTYSSDTPLKKGQVVLIPLGRSVVPGIVKSESKIKPSFPVKPIKSILYDTPLPSHLLKSLLWLCDYYLLPAPSVASLFLPVGIEKTRRKVKETPEFPQKIPFIPMSSAQKTALTAIKNTKSSTKLLHGITGSGKTNIYLSLADETLKSGRSTILLVPEIALTSQLVQIFESTFGRHVTLIHSQKTESERHQIWEHLLTTDEPQIIIGPRSALFAPLKNLGLIIIDEAHETSFYQENSPRYSTLRLASFIASTLDISCILGTATPLVTDYYLAQSQKSLISLSVKAKDTAITPSIKIVDLKNRDNFTKNAYISDALISAIKENLKNHHQTLIFHNRRGTSPLTICEKCGTELICPHCFLPLTLHSDSYSLVCHICGFSMNIPKTCPTCHSPNLLHKGFGTKLLETELKKLFRDAHIARFDADNKKQDSLATRYDSLKNGDIDIIIGTQTIAKGLDLPHLATVGIVQADSGLSLPDYAASEKTFHLLTQVIGRVGRGHLDSASVIIQSFQPDHPVILSSVNADYLGFSKYLLSERKKQHFPPFYYLARITATAKTERTVISHIKKIHSALSLKNQTDSHLIISPPTPVLHERSSVGFKWQIILRSHSRSALVSALKSLEKPSSIQITLDPPSLL